MSGRAPKSFKSSTIQYPSENTQSTGQYELMTSARRQTRGNMESPNRSPDYARKPIDLTKELSVQGQSMNIEFMRGESTSSLERIMDDLNSDRSKIYLAGKRRVSRRNLKKISGKTSEESSDAAENPVSSADEKTDFSMLSDEAENPRSNQKWGAQRTKKLSKKLGDLQTDYSSTYSQISDGQYRTSIQTEKIPLAALPRNDNGSSNDINKNANSNDTNNANNNAYNNANNSGRNNANYNGNYNGNNNANYNGRYNGNYNGNNNDNYGGRYNGNNDNYGGRNNAYNNGRYNANNSNNNNPNNANYNGRYNAINSYNNNAIDYANAYNINNNANSNGRYNANNSTNSNAQYNPNNANDEANKTYIQSEKIPPAVLARSDNANSDNNNTEIDNFNARYKATYNANIRAKATCPLSIENEQLGKYKNGMLGTSSEEHCQGEMKSEKVPPASLQKQCSDDMKKPKMAATMAFCTPKQNEPENAAKICGCNEKLLAKCKMSSAKEQLTETTDKMTVECNPIKCQTTMCCEEKCDFTAAMESKRVTPISASASASASTARLVLYYDIMSPQSRSCLMLICLLHLDVDLRYTDLLKGEQLTKEYLEINPVHTVPTLLHDNLVFTDSHTILMYLCDTFPSAQAAELFPTCYLDRMKIMNMLFFEAQVLYRRHSNFMTDIVRKDFANVDYYFHEKKIMEAYEALDTFLKDSSFLVGDKLTIADISMVATISALDLMFPVDLYTNSLPRLADWFRCMRAIPMYRLNFAGVQKQSEIVEQVGKFHIPTATNG